MRSTRSLVALGVASAAILTGVAITYGCGDDENPAGAGSSNGGTNASSSGSSNGGTSSSSGSAGTSSSGSTGGTSGGGTSSGASSGGTSGTPTVGGIFEVPEEWTKDVSGLTKDATSDAIIKALNDQGGWGQGNKLQIDFTIPLFFGNASTPRQTITKPAGQYCYGGPDCDPVPIQMPLPANGNNEGSTDYTCDPSGNTDGQGDCHVLVVAQDEKKLYEIYSSTKTANGFTALGVFVWDLKKTYPANMRGEQCTSADAAGFPIAALLPTADEVAAGEVKHALRFILPNERMRNKVYVHPASHAGDPKSPNPNSPPYGVRFRLKSTFDETPFNAGQKVILKALKKYGMLLSDGGNVALTFADDRTSPAKWAAQGITAQSFNAIGADNFEVVDLGPIIPSTQDCVRNP